MGEEINKTLGISFGLLSAKLSVQLKNQNFKFNSEKVEYFEKTIDAYNLLRILGHITDSQADQIIKKIYKAIEKHIMKSNNMIRRIQ